MYIYRHHIWVTELCFNNLLFCIFFFFIMNVYCLCNNKNVNFDSITKSKCWGLSVAVLCATSGLDERDKEKEGMEIERQWT